jgi:uncharacterized membrane protein (DUF2068 family)
MRVKGALRVVAVYEAAKGVLALVFGSSLLSVLHLRLDMQELAIHLAEHYHLNPASDLSRLFVETATKLDGRDLWTLTLLTGLYVVLRFTEAWGLWLARSWAEWLTALSGGVYIPFIIVELLRHPTWWTVSLLIMNIAVICFMAYCLLSKNATRPIAAHHSRS